MYYFLAALILLFSFGNDLTAQEAPEFVEAAEEGDWEEGTSAESAALATPTPDTVPVSSAEDYIPEAPSNIPQETLSETTAAEEETPFSDPESPVEHHEINTKSQQDMAIRASLPQAILPPQKSHDRQKQEKRNKEQIAKIRRQLSKTAAHRALQTASPITHKKSSTLLIPYKSKKSQ